MTRPQAPRSSLPYAVVIALALATGGCHWHTSAERAAEPILEKNAAARGGLKAWREVEALSMAGTLEAGRARDPVQLAQSYQQPRSKAKAEARKAVARHRDGEAEKQVQLPFVMELERPRKSRLEIRFQGQTAVQVYDGRQGWKLRPFLGRREVEPYSADELKIAAQQTALDGPLLGASAAGSRVELVGNEPVDGRDAFKLKVTDRDGQSRHVWVDAQTYLDVKVEGTRRLDGKPRTTWTAMRDYRAVDGVLVPHLLETSVEGVRGSEKIVVERVVVNPKLGEERFTRPALERT